MTLFHLDIHALATSAAICTLSLTLCENSAQQLPLPITQRSPAPSLEAVRPKDTLKSRIPIEILRVIDGDTVEVSAQIWLDQHVTTKVRLRSIDAPELQAKCPAEAKMAEASRQHLTTLVGTGRAYLTDLGRDKYGGRVVGSILTQQGENIATLLLKSGHARAYHGGKRESWC